MPRPLVLVLLLVSFAARGLTPEEVPAPLRPWVDWAVYQDRDRACPWDHDQSQRNCAWPGFLDLAIDGQGARFQQQWQLYAPTWVPLPGDAKHWPEAVRDQDQPARVADRDGQPGIWLSSGSHHIQGKFSWNQRPEYLPIPAATGLLSLTLDGHAIAIPNWDERGRLWLRATTPREAPANQDDRLDLRVFRKLRDGLPVVLTTRLELDIAGKHREIVLGPLFDPTPGETGRWIPLQLHSPLPARLEADGRLRLQARPGSWTVDFEARHHGDIRALAPAEAARPWPAEEVWAFEPAHHSRMVEVQGVPGIDPRQTGLPAAWQPFPAYRVLPGQTLRLEQRRRGDPTPAPDELTLQRELWLDFDGQGYTLRDTLSGTTTQGWRLEMDRPAVLGRVNVNGRDQFITRLENGLAGVEVRRGQLQLEADSRIDQARRSLPVSGWGRDFRAVNLSLHLPPGWRLLHASGVENQPNTWLNQWRMGSLFLVMITALAVFRLWGPGWGAVAFLSVLLSFHQAGAPHWSWLNLIAITALLQALPANAPFRRLLRGYQAMSIVVLLFILLPFLVKLTAQSLFPQVEYQWRGVQWNNGGAQQTRTEQVFDLAFDGAPLEEAPMAAPPPAPPAAKPVPQARQYDKLSSFSQDGSYYFSAKKRPLRQIDPGAQIQTGPGLPKWEWNAARFHWDGPVEAGQQFTIVLLGPWLNRILGLLTVGLCGVFGGLLIWRAWGGPFGSTWRKLTPATRGAAALALILALPWPGGAPMAADDPPPADWPSPQLLETLRKRLLEAPKCLPHCLSVPRMRMALSPGGLALVLEIHATTQVGLPLPGSRAQWQPREVLVNGEPAQALRRDKTGRLWVVLPAGQHQLHLRGPLPPRNTVQLSLPLPPRQATVQAEGWRVDGIHANGQTDGQLQFTREADDPAVPAVNDALESGALPPFVQVERTLRLGLDWQVETTVRRLSPPGSAIVLEIPLLEGESITSEQPRVEQGRALLNLAPQARELHWVSVFEQREEIVLRAPDQLGWMETWKLEVAPIWHVDLDGIPVVHHQQQGRWLPQWQPWPGEEVTLKIRRPQGVPGRILTVDRGVLEVNPGNRATDATLRLTLRASRGGPHKMELPANAKLQKVEINGVAQPLRLEEQALALPLRPGKQEIAITFRQPGGITAWFTTPKVNLATPGVNHRIALNLPENRWLLLAGGPSLGPAVLFWGVLLLLVAITPFLARLPLTPLRTVDWLLLGVVTVQVDIALTLIVFAWLLALGARRVLLPEVQSNWGFNLAQIALLGFSAIAIGGLAIAVGTGLMAQPEMFVHGNHSSEYHLYWYQDRVAEVPPQAWAFSVPLWIYRLALLAWALWLAFAFLRWLPWMVACLSSGGFRRSIPWPSKKKVKKSDEIVAGEKPSPPP